MRDKRKLLKTGVFGVTDTGEEFVVVGDDLVFQNGNWDSVTLCDENLSLYRQKIQKLVECNSFFQLLCALTGSDKYPIIYDRERDPFEIAIKNMMTLEIPIKYICDFQEHGTVNLINGRTATPVDENTHLALYQFIKSVESSRNVIVYAVFNEPNVHGQKTDIYALLYLEKDAADNPQYEIDKENNLCKTMTYNWCESTGIAEPAWTYFQISDGGVWCLPNSIARVVAPHFDSEASNTGSLTPKAIPTFIEELDLAVRPYNCLKRAGINIVEDLINKTPSDLQKIPNMGRHGVDSIIETLHSLGLKLKEAPPREALSLRESVMQMTIDELKMSVKTKRMLKKAEIHTVGEIVEYTDWDFLLLENDEEGVENLCEIEATLYSLGLKLKENPFEKLTID